MADTTITPTGNGEAIPALYRRYLLACTRVIMGDDPQAENELQEIVEALARTTGKTPRDLLALADVYHQVAGCRVDDSAALDDQMFAAVFRTIRKMAPRPAPLDSLSVEQRRAWYILKDHHRDSQGAPIHIKDWHRAHSADRAATGLEPLKRKWFEHVIRALILRNYAKEEKWDHYVSLVWAD